MKAGHRRSDCEHRDPLSIMLAISDHFIGQAETFDTKVHGAIDAGANPKDILALMGLADESRMKALAAAGQAAPYVRPRLQAIELAPASPATQSRFDQRIEHLSDDEIASALKQIASGKSALALLEAADADLELCHNYLTGSYAAAAFGDRLASEMPFTAALESEWAEAPSDIMVNQALQRARSAPERSALLRSVSAKFTKSRAASKSFAPPRSAR
jgi:hypothetical protein